MAQEERSRGAAERGGAGRRWQREVREALAQVERDRDDAVVYLAAIKRMLDVVARGHGSRQCAQEIAEAFLHELGVEGCAVALRDLPEEDIALAGFATQAQRLGGPPDTLGESGWLTLAQLGGADPEPTCFRRAPDGGFGAVTAIELEGEGFIVLPFRCGPAPGGAVVLHALVAPAQVFARARALALLAEIAGQVLATARTRESIEALCGDLEGELGVTRRVLSAQQERLRSSEENIAGLTQALIRSNRVKREFLGTVSHELRTPLNAILGYAGLVREGMAGAIAEPQAVLLDRVLTNSRSLGALIDDMLFFVQLEADRVTVQRERVATAEVVGEVLASIPDAAERPDVRVALDVAPEAAVLAIDPGLLRRMLFHLVGNAFKFTARGEYRITLSASPDPGAAVLSVRDTGVGIPPERLNDIFELFAQADGSTTRRYNGLGLGLTLVQRCVRLLGGEVTATSQPGLGSDFRVTLPGALDDVDPVVDAEPARTVH